MHERRLEGLGIATMHTRVESWECDFNDHWNARYYSRSFQMAAECVASMGGGQNPGMGAIGQRVIRFHRELYVGAAMEIRSVRIEDGEHAGAVVHVLSSGGHLSATAFDLPGTGGEHLPAAPAKALAQALPRGNILAHVQAGPEAADHVTLGGTVRAYDLDHTGALLYEAVIGRIAHGMYDKLNHVGFTADFTRETGVGRMASQSCLRRTGALCPAGTVLRVRSRIGVVGAKIFSTWHCLETMAGVPLAYVAHDVLAVDLHQRRAVPPPAFLRAAAHPMV